MPVNLQHRRIVPKPVRGHADQIEYHLAYEDGRCCPECGEGKDHPGEGSLRSARKRWPGVSYVPAAKR